MSASGTLGGAGLNVGNGVVMLPRSVSKSMVSVKLVIEWRFRAWRCRRTRKIASRAMKKPNEPKTDATIAALFVGWGRPAGGLVDELEVCMGGVERGRSVGSLVDESEVRMDAVDTGGVVVTEVRVEVELEFIVDVWVVHLEEVEPDGVEQEGLEPKGPVLDEVGRVGKPLLAEVLAPALLDADEVVDREMDRGVVEGGLGVVDGCVLRATPRPVAVDIKGGHSTPKARKPVITSAIGQI